jgi:hypothetical protein
VQPTLRSIEPPSHASPRSITMGLKNYIFAQKRSDSVDELVTVHHPGSRVRNFSSTTETSLPVFDHSEHEMVVAYLYQHQCSKFWISNIKSDNEGAFMRVDRNSYATCPKELEDCPLAAACSAFNIQVHLPLYLSNGLPPIEAQTTSYISAISTPY